MPMMQQGHTNVYTLLLFLFGIVPAFCQWGWNNPPNIVVKPPPPPQSFEQIHSWNQAPRQQPPMPPSPVHGQPMNPQPMNPQPMHGGHVHGGHVHGQPMMSYTTPLPLEVEPAEVEIFTTPPRPIPHMGPHGAGVHGGAPPRNPWGWNPQSWSAQRVPPPQQPPPHQPHQPHQPNQPPQRPPQPAQSRPPVAPPIPVHQVQPNQAAQWGAWNQPVQPPPQVQAQPSNPLQRYDVFSQNFDAQAFERAHYLAFATTTQAPPPQQGYWGQNDWNIQPTNSWNPPTTAPPPLPATTDFVIKVNPFRESGFYLGPNPSQLDPNKKNRPPPATQIIEIRNPADNGISANPLDSFMGNTPPAAAKATTPLPGKDGNVFAGFLGFHVPEPSTPPPKQPNEINDARFASFFAPVPGVDNQNHPNAGGAGPRPPQPPTAKDQQMAQMLKSLLEAMAKNGQTAKGR